MFPQYNWEAMQLHSQGILWGEHAPGRTPEGSQSDNTLWPSEWPRALFNWLPVLATTQTLACCNSRPHVVSCFLVSDPSPILTLVSWLQSASICVFWSSTSAWHWPCLLIPAWFYLWSPVSDPLRFLLTKLRSCNSSHSYLVTTTLAVQTPTQLWLLG